MKTKRQSMLAAIVMTSLSVGVTSAQVVIDSTIVGNRRDGFGAQTHTIATALNASGSDKMVVAVSTEHNFGGTALPSVPIITFGEETLTLAESAPSNTSGRVSIFYLDNPGSGDLVYQETGGSNGSAWTVLLLSGTAEGMGSTASDPSDSVDLTTTAGGSFVFSALMTDAPTVSGTPIPRPTADAPQTEIAVEGWNPGREYGVLATGSQDGGAAGNTVTASWTNPNTPGWGSVIAVAEILSASGGSGPFQINAISYSATTNEVTLTWPKTGALSYVVNASPDLVGWEGEVGSGITEAADEEPGDADNLTVTLTLPIDLQGSGKLFFRVETGP